MDLGSLPQPPWVDLSSWEKREVVTRVVATILYPPSKKAGKSSKVGWRREKAAVALLAKHVSTHIDDLISALVRGETKTNPKLLAQLAETISQQWKEGWTRTLYHAGSSGFYNKKKPKKAWPQLANLYLIAVALIRQRHDHAKTPLDVSKPGLQRAIWMVRKTYPAGCEYDRKRKVLEAMTREAEPIWPLVCGLIHCLVIPRMETLNDIRSIHELLPKGWPKTQDMIDAVLNNPHAFWSAANFFQHHLALKDESNSQFQPLIDPLKCEPLLCADHTSFQLPLYLTGLTEQEAKVAGEYKVKAYNVL